MKRRNKKKTVLMTGPAASVQGGIRTVVNQYLGYKDWTDTELMYIPSHIEGAALKKIFFFAGCVIKVVVTCASEQVDILHMHVSERGSFWRKAFLLKLCRKKGIKTIMHHHGAEFFDFYEKSSPKAKERIAEIIGMADVNLVLSDYHKTMLHYKFPDARFEVLYNAVPDVETQVYKPDAAGILFVGRMCKRKGIYDLLDVLEELEGTLPPDIRFFFCGDGEVEHVTELLRVKKLDQRVAHIGWCTKEQLRLFYGETMMFILPSYHEGLPMSLLEAMHSGIPCITTRVDGMPEVVDSGNNGLLIEPGCLEQLKHSLLRLLQDRQLRKTLGENARQTVHRQFLLDAHIRTLEVVYSKLKGDLYV